VVDSQNRIFIAADGTSVSVVGTVILPGTSPAKANTLDKHGDDDLRRRSWSGCRQFEDFNEDLNDDHPNATFALTLLTGESVSGNPTFATARNSATSP
jgi:hypothetical protein